MNRTASRYAAAAGERPRTLAAAIAELETLRRAAGPRRLAVIDEKLRRLRAVRAWRNEGGGAMSAPRIQAACRKCGGARLAAEVVAWGVFEAGDLVNVDIAQPIAAKPGGHALCLDCMEAQPIGQAEELPL